MKTIPIHLADRFDLSEYEKEPLHIPGLIQPHGILFVLKEENLEILQVSENVQDFFADTANNLIGKKLKDIFSTYHLKKIKQYIADQKLTHLKPFTIKLNKNHPIFNGIIHHSEGKFILELEQNFNEKKSEPIINYKLEQAVLNIRRGKDLIEVCQKIAQEVKKLTQFDRVLVYQFGFDGAGIVIAEEVSSG